MATQGLDIAGYEGLGADINKQKGETTPENKMGLVSNKLPELELEMKDEDLVKLLQKWEKIWKESPAKAEWEKQIEENENYWLGKQFDLPKGNKDRPMVDNLVFESVETYLPQVTRRNPDPMVKLDSKEEMTPQKEKYVEKVKLRLSDLADENKIRLKLKKGARHWAIYQLGVAKLGWDLDKNIPIARIVRPKRIILDPEATIDEDGYNGEYIGEYRKLSASKIISIIGEKNNELDEKGEVIRKGNGEALKAIKDLVKDDLATMVSFEEWWTREYMCWRFNSHILLKKKNPHWNYDTEEVKESVDDYGNATSSPEPVEGINHFASPKMPYEFLSVFNLGDQPMDKTSLLHQNLSNQDKINKRNKQIDKNVDRINGGMVVSLGRSGLTQSQAKGVTEALRKGGVVIIPDGAPSEAIQQYSPNGLPNDVYNDLVDTRSRMRDIFGVRGSSQAGIESEKTVRGKIIGRGLDTDRIGGGVTEYLEQFADNIYNWFVQLLYVYDDGFQFLAEGRPPKVVVSVKEGSLLPKDSTSIANQALELAGLNKISNLDLYKRLEYPNPEEMAANVWLEVNAPHLLYKDNPLIQEALMMQQQQAQMQAEQEQEKSGQSHERDMEKEMVKGEMKMRGEEAKRSLLSLVPQQ